MSSGPGALKCLKEKMALTTSVGSNCLSRIERSMLLKLEGFLLMLDQSVEVWLVLNIFRKYGDVCCKIATRSFIQLPLSSLK